MRGNLLFNRTIWLKTQKKLAARRAANLLCRLQPIEALKGTEKFLKVPRSGTFKNFSVPFKASIGCKRQSKLAARRAANLFWVLIQIARLNKRLPRDARQSFI